MMLVRRGDQAREQSSLLCVAILFCFAINALGFAEPRHPVHGIVEKCFILDESYVHDLISASMLSLCNDLGAKDIYILHGNYSGGNYDPNYSGRSEDHRGWLMNSSQYFQNMQKKVRWDVSEFLLVDLYENRTAREPTPFIKEVAKALWTSDGQRNLFIIATFPRILDANRLQPGRKYLRARNAFKSYKGILSRLLHSNYRIMLMVHMPEILASLGILPEMNDKRVALVLPSRIGYNWAQEHWPWVREIKCRVMWLAPTYGHFYHDRELFHPLSPPQMVIVGGMSPGKRDYSKIRESFGSIWTNHTESAKLPIRLKILGSLRPKDATVIDEQLKDIPDTFLLPYGESISYSAFYSYVNHSSYCLAFFPRESRYYVNAVSSAVLECISWGIPIVIDKYGMEKLGDGYPPGTFYVFDNIEDFMRLTRSEENYAALVRRSINASVSCRKKALSLVRHWLLH